MRNLPMRLRKLESRHFDATGLVPYSDAWFDFLEDKFIRRMNGEDIGSITIPLAVADRMIEAADRADRAESESGKRLECDDWD